MRGGLNLGGGKRVCFSVMILEISKRRVKGGDTSHRYDCGGREVKPHMGRPVREVDLGGVVTRLLQLCARSGLVASRQAKSNRSRRGRDRE